MDSSDLEDRVVADVEARLEEAVAAFRDQHRHPLNLALHALAAVLAARGAGRLLRGRLVSGAAGIGAAVGLVVVGHRVEGNEPFAVLRQLRQAVWELARE